MKRILAAAAAAAVTVAALAGCTAGGSSPGATSAAGKNTKLTFLVFETPNLTAKYWDDIIAKTSKKVPGVTIEKITAPSAEKRDEYARQLDSTGKLPDIMVAISPNGLADAGKLAQFSSGELSDWVNPTSNSFDGKIYQLPTNTQTWQIYYNKGLFTKAGISAPPTTWGDFLADSQKLKDKGIPPLLIGGGPDTLGPRWLFDDLVANDLYSKSPNWLADLAKGKANFSDPGFQTALQQFKQLAPYASKPGLSQGYADAQSAFLAGKAAMYGMGSWFPAAPNKQQQDQIGVFPLPTTDGKLVLPAYTGGGLSVSAKAADVTKAKKWAIEFSKQNADGGAKFDGLFVSLKGYNPPSGLPKLYTDTLDLYKKAQDSGTVTTSFGYEGGTTALPSGLITNADSALLDLIAGRKSVSQVTDYLNGKLKDLQK